MHSEKRYRVQNSDCSKECFGNLEIKHTHGDRLFPKPSVLSQLIPGEAVWMLVRCGVISDLATTK